MAKEKELYRLCLWMFVVEIVNFVVKQTSLTAGPIIRLFPMLFAVAYFGLMASKKYKNSRWILFIPIVAIALPEAWGQHLRHMQ